MPRCSTDPTPVAPVGEATVKVARDSARMILMNNIVDKLVVKRGDDDKFARVSGLYITKVV